MMRKLVVTLSLLSLAGCAAIERPDPSNTAAYCSPENAFRLGTESRAYFGGCPKESESAFLSALDRGRLLWPVAPQVWPYYSQMSQLEKQLVATSDEAQRQRLRAQLAEAEWWAIHLYNNAGTYQNF